MSDPLVAPFGSSTSGVMYRTGTNYEDAGTKSSPENRPFLHDYRPLGIAEGGTAPFSTDGCNLFIGPGAGNFTMAPLDVPPAGTDRKLQCSHNLGLGAQSLSHLTIGYKNHGLGVNALRFLTSGHGNTAVGRDSGHNLKTGHENTYFGFTCGQLGVSGNYNAVLGTAALYHNLDGSGNAVLGRRAGFAWTTGDYNTLLGNEAGYGQTSGDYCTYVGKQAANNGILTSDSCTVVGARVTDLPDTPGSVTVANGAGFKVLTVQPLGTTASYLDLVSKDVTAVNLAATDGQAYVGSSMILRSGANVGNALCQIAAQSRTGGTWNRLVFWGGITMNTSFITNNVERMRINAAGDTSLNVNASAAALSVNRTMTFELTSDTSLTIKVRGTDGITRSHVLALT